MRWFGSQKMESPKIGRGIALVLIAGVVGWNAVRALGARAPEAPKLPFPVPAVDEPLTAAKSKQTAVLAGDPSKEGPYVMRIKSGGHDGAGAHARQGGESHRHFRHLRRRHVYASRQEQGTKSFPPVRSSELIRKRRILLGRKATPSCR